MIHGRPLLWLRASNLLMLLLNSYRRQVSFMFSLHLFRPGALIDATRAAVIADPVRGVVVDYRRVVNIMNVGDIHVVDGAIVEKVPAVPSSTFIAVAEVAESVIDSAIESDLRAPIAFMENECFAAPAPPARSPKETNFGRQHPG